MDADSKQSGKRRCQYALWTEEVKHEIWLLWWGKSPHMAKSHVKCCTSLLNVATKEHAMGSLWQSFQKNRSSVSVELWVNNNLWLTVTFYVFCAWSLRYNMIDYWYNMITWDLTLIKINFLQLNFTIMYYYIKSHCLHSSNLCNPPPKQTNKQKSIKLLQQTVLNNTIPYQ